MGLIEKGTDYEEYESVQNFVLYGLVKNTAQNIEAC